MHSSPAGRCSARLRQYIGDDCIGAPGGDIGNWPIGPGPGGEPSRPGSSRFGGKLTAGGKVTLGDMSAVCASGLPNAAGTWGCCCPGYEYAAPGCDAGVCPCAAKCGCGCACGIVAELAAPRMAGTPDICGVADGRSRRRPVHLHGREERSRRALRRRRLHARAMAPLRLVRGRHVAGRLAPAALAIARASTPDGCAPCGGRSDSPMRARTTCATFDCVTSWPRARNSSSAKRMRSAVG